MSRSIRISAFAFAVLGMLAACGKPTTNQETAPAGGGDPGGKIAVPGAKGADPSTNPGTTPGGANIGAPGASIDDPRFHLQADEGTLTIDKADGKAGAPLAVAIKLVPGSGRHLATDYPIKVTLEPTPGVTLTKTELKAGGRDKERGDADTLSEQQIAFAVTATADKAGAYEIKGTFKFGVCDSESCHPKKQPITISIAAN